MLIIKNKKKELAPEGSEWYKPCDIMSDCQIRQPAASYSKYADARAHWQNNCAQLLPKHKHMVQEHAKRLYKLQEQYESSGSNPRCNRRSTQPATLPFDKRMVQVTKNSHEGAKRPRKNNLLSS